MKVAASPRIYMGRCPKVVFKLQVTSHKSLVTSHSAPLIPSHSSLLSNFGVQGSGFRVQGCGGGFAANIYEALLIFMRRANTPNS